MICGDFFENLADFSFGSSIPNSSLNNFKTIDIKTIDDFVVNFNKNRFPIFFVNSDRVTFFLDIVKDYEKKIILISHNGDLTFNEDIVLPPCIKHWFGQNINFTNNSRVTSIPIGLERDAWFPYKRPIILDFINKKSNKNNLLYCNFNQSTNPRRSFIKDYFKNKHWCLSRENIEYRDYIADINSSKFVISPNGNGIDCHRTWEILYSGSVPILEKSPCIINTYKDFNTIIVDNFLDVTEELLETQCFDQKEIDYETYYKKLIFPL